jgi:hypothetical protein
MARVEQRMDAPSIMLLVRNPVYNTARRSEIYDAYVVLTDLQLVEQSLTNHGLAFPAEIGQAMRTAQRTLERLVINQRRHLGRLIMILLHIPVYVDL